MLVPVLLVVIAIAAFVASLIPGIPGAHATSAPAIPSAQLAVMQDASAETGVPWPVLAAIASVESGFGANMATSSAGAVGYGQFLPSTWALFGRGGDPYDFRDAIPAMARLLAAAGAATDLPGAVYAYNHSWSYVAHRAGTREPVRGRRRDADARGRVLPAVARGGGPVIRGRGAAYALLAIAAVLLAIAAASGWSGASGLAARRDDRAAVEAAARSFVAAYGNFDFRDAGAYAARLADLSTGDLQHAVAKAAVDPAAIAAERTSSSRVESVTVTALSGGNAAATVRSTQDREWRDPASGALVHQQVTQDVSLGLVRTDGRWLVADFQLLGQQPAVAASGGR